MLVLGGVGRGAERRHSREARVSGVVRRALRRQLEVAVSVLGRDGRLTMMLGVLGGVLKIGLGVLGRDRLRILRGMLRRVLR